MRVKRRVGQQINAKKWLLIFAIVFICFISVVVIKSWHGSVFLATDSFSWVVIDKSGKTLIVSQQGQDTGSLVIVPSQMSMMSAKNLGSYAVANLYELGEQQGVGGGLLVKQTIQENLHVPIDKFIYTKKSLDKDNGPKLSWALKKIVLGSILLNQGATDLIWFDRVKIATYLFTHKLSTWSLIDLDKYTAKQDDGQLVIKDESKTNDMFLYAFADEYLFNQNLKMGIVNNTNCHQAADKIIKLMGNLGILAVPLTNVELPLIETNTLFLPASLNLTKGEVNRVARLLSARMAKPDHYSWSEDMILVIGEQYCHLVK